MASMTGADNVTGDVIIGEDKEQLASPGNSDNRRRTKRRQIDRDAEGDEEME